MRLLLIFMAAAIFSCAESDTADKKPTVMVSIAPIEWIASNLLDSTVNISVMVPAGSSPETYEPTVKQIQILSDATVYFSIGLMDFEEALYSRIEDIANGVVFVELADGLDIVAGDCGHRHSHHSDADGEHGVDPHIWLSPKMMRSMVDKVALVVCDLQLNPAQAVMRRADSLKQLIDSLDSDIRLSVGDKNIKFAIVHPSLSYFARDYGMTQISIEVDGKEPSALVIKQLVDTLKANNISQILYGVQNSDASARVIAAEIGGRLTPYDPLEREWLQGMRNITTTLCN